MHYLSTHGREEAAGRLADLVESQARLVTISKRDYRSIFDTVLNLEHRAVPRPHAQPAAPLSSCLSPQ